LYNSDSDLPVLFFSLVSFPLFSGFIRIGDLPSLYYCTLLYLFLYNDNLGAIVGRISFLESFVNFIGEFCSRKNGPPPLSITRF